MFPRSLACLLVFLITAATLNGSDWTRFRGPNGTGVSPDDITPPTTWSESQNIKWKVDLPGPGLSSPIVIGDRVIITCWTGYAAGGEGNGSLDDLKRSVVCLDRQTGSEIWSNAEVAVLQEGGEEVADLLVEADPQAELVTIPGVAHMVNLEAPGEFDRVLLEFLGRF